MKVAPVEQAFRHEALFYSGGEGFLAGALPFVEQALQAEEPVLVAVSEQRAELLRQALGEDAERVRFLEAQTLENPARAMPAWREFLEEHAQRGRTMRGICEAVWPGRSTEELDECERHETLLNEVFANGPAWHLLCPYDLDGLGAEAIATARRTHPGLMHEGVSRRSNAYDRRQRVAWPFAGSLPARPEEREELSFTSGGLGAIRSLVAQHAIRAGLTEPSREDLVLAVNELVTNSVQYGGGGGTLSIWPEAGELVCEVRDHGFIEDPLAGRIPPPVDQYGGRGLWLVNQLCDLVQIRSGPEGTVARVRMRAGERPTWR
ncbi:MAG TPA: sensor histidine kinase [Solirubrobacteraceae bacterium]|nr:sensor histidine kinase [Solirubrobacteraceae bacterium]